MNVNLGALGIDRLSVEDRLELIGEIWDSAMPSLAGTYDERMFERLRTRAQVFDILTGGDPTADQGTDGFWLDPDSEGDDDGASFVPLPRLMLDDLRVNLAVRLVDSSSG